VEINEEDYLAHYGILRRSGRYPWGSGKTPDERGRSFMSTVKELKDKHGMSEAQIAKSFGMSTTELRAAKSIAKNETLQADINMAQRLKDKGWSNVKIGERMGKNESYVRTLLEPGKKDRVDIQTSTANMLREAVAQKKYIDIGSGVEYHLGIPRQTLDVAISRLESEGYHVLYLKVDQIGTKHQTTTKVLAAPGTDYKEFYKNRDQVQLPSTFSTDNGRNYDRILPPLSISSNRVAVRYAEEGGTHADGVIFVRPGKKDLSLGGGSYAQVRIAIDGTHYLKGMAVYKDDLPEGVDLLFNTNKSNTGNKLDAMKSMKKDSTTGKIDEENPFGAMISRQLQSGEPGKKRVTSAMNIVNEEGDWDRWSKTLSSQMLSKQSKTLAKEQLGEALRRKQDEFDSLRQLTNPAVKQKLLKSFSDDADSSAIHLKAAALPGQRTHVILPVESMKPTEVYAPNFRDGDRVVLVRFPHGGKFEIPELIVNNRQPEARRTIGPNAKDAIGIHHTVAERLSGADFDGDTVLVIPNNNRKIKTEPALEGLKGFDPQRAYPKYDGMPVMSPRTKQVEMGKISNLVSDMTIKGANSTELAAAVRHSMVVIDAEKHKLDYRGSAKANGIAALRKRYQEGPQGGASTLISNSGTTSTTRINERKARSVKNGGPIDLTTGEKKYEETGARYIDRKGKDVPKTIEVPRLGEVKNAHDLSSGTPIEMIYADHSNALKHLANQARLEMVHTKPMVANPTAKKVYAEQVRTLNAKLNVALRNSPLERQANIIAGANIRAKRAANPDLEKAEIKKLESRELNNARMRTGAVKQRIVITDEEWRAIQAGAISHNKMDQILQHADLERVKELASPRNHTALNDSQKSKALTLLRRGYTQVEVADALGVKLSELKRALIEGA
jgi:transcriptional regulator with XRE-family HTH domain